MKYMEKINYESFMQMVDNGVIDALYGSCFPKCFISYTREYYAFEEIRVTIDKNLIYRSYLDDELYFNDDEFVFEIKTSADKNLLELSNKFRFLVSRFSKYERAINALFNLQY